MKHSTVYQGAVGMAYRCTEGRPALLAGWRGYGAKKLVMGLRLPAEPEREGADLSIQRIRATPPREASWQA